MTFSAHLVKLRKSAEYRRECGRAIVATEKLIREIAPSTTIHTLLVAKENGDIEAGEVRKVKPSLLERVSGLKTTTDMVAEVEMPQESNLENLKRILVLDQLTDPGNVGTLLRTALAFGWDGVFFLEGGVDPFHEKVVRASRGALFRLPYCTGSKEDLLKLSGSFECLVADTKGEAVGPTTSDKLMLILGSEAHGPSVQFGKTITIPMEGEMESLNVAISGSILLHALAHSKSKRSSD